MNRFLFILEWTSTIVLLLGVALTSWNVYPLNLYVSVAGNIGWMIIAFFWKKWSIITVQVVIVLIYISGMIDKGLIGV